MAASTVVGPPGRPRRGKGRQGSTASEGSSGTAPTWHAIESGAALARLGSDPARGLGEAEAARRLAEHGPNELLERGRKRPWRIAWEQLTATMVVVLLVAAVISALLGDRTDAAAILTIVALNALLGFSQEYRAERAMAALKRLAVPRVRARRAGRVRALDARALVPGDIILLEAGDLVPADARLLEGSSLRAQEAALTGESAPVEKDPAVQSAPDLAPGDRRNMLYLGTGVTYGRGLALVTATGMATELGRIAALLQSVAPEPTPLQRRLDQLGRQLALIALGLVAAIFALGLLRGEDPRLLFLTAVSVAVAAIPEGLPAVVTIALALGAQRMLGRRTLIRKLAAVEALGAVTAICADKTGTLTANRMTVAALDVAGHRADPAADADTGHPALALLLAGAALCNDTIVGTDGEEPAGDPTETALVVAAARGGLAKADLDAAFPRVAELPFDAARRCMTTVHRVGGPPPGGPARLAGAVLDGAAGAPYVAFTKGAADALLAISGLAWVEDRAVPLDDALRARIGSANDRLGGEGLRVLGVAFRPLAAPGPVGELERDLTFVGLVGMHDPPRAEARAAVATCRAAGIRPLMITGDHPQTAAAIARSLGIAADGRVATGADLDRLADPELARLVGEVSVYARVAPEHKLRIVRALRDRGQIVAMTGDGVNDAPALRQADIGVAMGVVGTDVAKEAADMVLLDDNFATIVAAVEEGRGIYDNIRKFLKYLMATNSAEIAVMLAAPVLGMPLPLLPLQILWINLVTDGPPALALGLEPTERDAMRRPPRRPNERILGRELGRHVIWVGLLMTALALGPGYLAWRAGLPQWQTLLFTTLTMAQLGHVLAIRTGRAPAFGAGVGANGALLGAVALTAALQLAVVYLPALQRVFHTTALSAGELALSAALGSVVFWAVELEKWLQRRAGAAGGARG